MFGTIITENLALAAVANFEALVKLPPKMYCISYNDIPQESFTGVAGLFTLVSEGTKLSPDTGLISFAGNNAIFETDNNRYLNVETRDFNSNFISNTVTQVSDVSVLQEAVNSYEKFNYTKAFSTTFSSKLLTIDGYEQDNCYLSLVQGYIEESGYCTIGFIANNLGGGDYEMIRCFEFGNKGFKALFMSDLDEIE
jgi:hypothetical protein